MLYGAKYCVMWRSGECLGLGGVDGAGALSGSLYSRAEASGELPASGAVEQADVAAAAVALRRMALDHAGTLEHLEVEREQVRGEPCQVTELAGRVIGPRQGVDDLQPVGVAERRMHGRTSISIGVGAHHVRLNGDCLNHC